MLCTAILLLEQRLLRCRRIYSFAGTDCWGIAPRPQEHRIQTGNSSSRCRYHQVGALDASKLLIASQHFMGDERMLLESEGIGCRESSFYDIRLCCGGAPNQAPVSPWIPNAVGVLRRVRASAGESFFTAANKNKPNAARDPTDYHCTIDT